MNVGQTPASTFPSLFLPRLVRLPGRGAELQHKDRASGADLGGGRRWDAARLSLSQVSPVL